MPRQAELVQTLETSLNWLNKKKLSQENAKEYRKVIEDFPTLSPKLQALITRPSDPPKPINAEINDSDLIQEILQTSSQLQEENQRAQHEFDRAREINNTRSHIPEEQSETRRALTDVERRLQMQAYPVLPMAQAQTYLRQAESAAHKARIDELELAQLSASNRQELARIRGEIHQKKARWLDDYLKRLRARLNSKRQYEAQLALESTKQWAQYSDKMPPVITAQFNQNRDLSAELNQQAQNMDDIADQQRQVANQIIEVHHALSTIREQSKLLGTSNLLGDALRAQVSRLREIPKHQQLTNNIAHFRAKRLEYERLLNTQSLLKQPDHQSGTPLTNPQRRTLEAQLATRRELLRSLISGYDTMVLEATQLALANNQLEDALTDMKEAEHQYLFWTADIAPVNFNYPLNLLADLSRLLSMDTLSQLSGAFVSIFTNRGTLLPIVGALLLIGISISSRRHYYAFLERTTNCVGKVTQDRFSLTLHTVLWSVVIAMPLPVLWAATGYSLKFSWNYPVASAIGGGMLSLLPVLSVIMIIAAFAREQGLFVVHFRWPKQQVLRAMRYYPLLTSLIVPLQLLIFVSDKIEEHRFYSTLGLLCFVLFCLILSLFTVSLKHAGLPLHVDKTGNSNNLLNRLLWNILISIPLIAALSSTIGFMATAQTLLMKLLHSVTILFLLMIIYHIIRRWMFIQRRRIAYDRARQRRADMLASRARGEEEAPFIGEGLEIEEPVIDLNIISAQSLRLVRFILTLIALVAIILLWSEMNSAFSFLMDTKKGAEIPNNLTPGSVLFNILVLVITIQFARNMPALLELALLQHLSLTPGTGYAITTLTRYLLLVIGGLIIFSKLGIDWSKLGWVVASLGFGLGFGTKEIFLNFISGLFILVEKPIRINDTVTIQNLTGTITRINMRATTITDWDRKEIIVPNKAFINEQFINWSLSDSVTRIVLTIPAPISADSDSVCRILLQASERCNYVVDTPPPEVFLNDLQQGIQLFELRVHAAEIGHRMLLRHELHQLILQGFNENNIQLPFPPFQLRLERSGRHTCTSSDEPST